MMLKIENLSCGYSGSFMLNDINLQVEKGEKLCIIGPNGCGKTTLLKAVVGLIDHEGKISINGADLKTLKRKEVAAKVALMTQLHTVYFAYTVFETVMLGRYSKREENIFGRPSKRDTEAVNDCLETLKIAHLKDRIITQLSGGELQRVFLARAFAQDPEILILDEPTNHLDLKYQIQLMEELEKWCYTSGKTVVAVMHDINLAVNFADKIALMSKGEIVAHNNKANFLDGVLISQVYDLDVKEYMKESYSIWT